MKRTSTWGVLATTYAVVLGFGGVYAIALSIYHGSLMYLRLWTHFLTLALLAAPVVLLFSAIVAFTINRLARGRAED